MNDRLRGIALVAGAAALWSTGGAFVRLLETQNSWTTIFWRSASAFAFLLAFIAIANRGRFIAQFRRLGWPGLLVGACFASASISMVIALSMTSVARLLIILSITPLIAALLGRIFLKEPITRATLAAIAAVVVGMIVMVWGTESQGSLLGDFFALVMAASYAAAIVTSRRHPQIGMMPGACVGAACAALVSLPFAEPLAVSAHDLPIMLAFGAIQLGGAMALFVTGVRLIPAALSALLAMIESILGPVWVWLLFGEQPAATVLIGGAIVILSVAAKTIRDSRQAIPEPPAV